MTDQNEEIVKLEQVVRKKEETPSFIFIKEDESNPNDLGTSFYFQPFLSNLVTFIL